MPDIYDKENLTKEEYTQGYIVAIRTRSRTPNAEFRRRMWEAELDLWRGLAKAPDNIVAQDILTKLEARNIEDFAEEDRDRDRNMITSADLLDLHLAELADFKRFNEPGIYSERTEMLAEKARQGLIWGIEADKKYPPPGLPIAEPDPKDPLEALKIKLQSGQRIGGALVTIHQVLGTIHTSRTSRIPIRDLQWEREAINPFLNFLSRELK